MEEILKEILSQMHVMSNKLQEVSVKQDDTNKRIDDTNKRITKLETTIENKTNLKIQALFEDREIVHDKLDNISGELEVIKEKITEHDMKIQVINNSKAI